MTEQELETLIKLKIEGQGTAIDAGSVLPKILKGMMALSSVTVEDKTLIFGYN